MVSSLMAPVLVTAPQHALLACAFFIWISLYLDFRALDSLWLSSPSTQFTQHYPCGRPPVFESFHLSRCSNQKRCSSSTLHYLRPHIQSDTKPCELYQNPSNLMSLSPPLPWPKTPSVLGWGTAVLLVPVSAITPLRFHFQHTEVRAALHKLEVWR